MARVRLALLTISALLAVVGPTTGWVEGPSSSSTTLAVKTFNAAFVPDQVVAADGLIWLVGSGPKGGDCRVGRLNPATLALATFVVHSCGMNVTAGDGSLFLETAVPDVKSQSYAVHVERFSTAAHTSGLYRTVSATLFLGSDIAHTQFAYADGALWLYVQGHSAEVLRLSRSTGTVVHTYRAVPQTGGGEPLVASTPGYVWFAGGAGTGADFERVDVADGAASAVQPVGAYASVYDMSGLGDQLYFLYLAGGASHGAQAGGSFIEHLAPGGTVIGTSPEEQVGTTLVYSSGQLFSVGPGRTCGAGIPVWRVDQGTLRTTVVATLAPPGDPCLGDEGARPVAAADGSIFVLYSSAGAAVLYHVTPSEGGI